MMTLILSLLSPSQRFLRRSILIDAQQPLLVPSSQAPAPPQQPSLSSLPTATPKARAGEAEEGRREKAQVSQEEEEDSLSDEQDAWLNGILDEDGQEVECAVQQLTGHGGGQVLGLYLQMATTAPAGLHSKALRQVIQSSPASPFVQYCVSIIHRGRLLIADWVYSWCGDDSP